MEFIDRSQMRISSLMWGDTIFPYIERNEVRSSSLADICAEVDEWQFICEKLFKHPRAVILDVSWNPRFVKATGRCCKNGNSFHLEFNAEYMRVCSAENFHETIAHEVIHTLPGAQNHGPTFRRYAAILANVTRVNVARLQRDEAYEAVYKARKDRRIKYEIICKKCGIVAQRQRACDLVVHPEAYRCGICSGALTVSKI